MVEQLAEQSSRETTVDKGELKFQKRDLFRQVQEAPAEVLEQLTAWRTLAVARGELLAGVSPSGRTRNDALTSAALACQALGQLGFDHVTGERTR